MKMDIWSRIHIQILYSHEQCAVRRGGRIGGGGEVSQMSTVVTGGGGQKLRKMCGHSL